MHHRTAATFVAAAALSVLVVSPAHAEDRRPCVSNVEYNSATGYVQHNGIPTQAELERHWEVSRLGRPTYVDGFGSVVAYPRCGYGFDPLDPYSGEGFYGMIPNRDGRVHIIIGYVDPAARAHGHV